MEILGHVVSAQSAEASSDVLVWQLTPTQMMTPPPRVPAI
jgi:hypothetical protein